MTWPLPWPQVGGRRPEGPLSGQAVVNEQILISLHVGCWYVAPECDSANLYCSHRRGEVGLWKLHCSSNWTNLSASPCICKFSFLVSAYHHHFDTCIYPPHMQALNRIDCGWRSAYATKMVKVSYSSHYARYHYRIQPILKPALSRTRMSSKHQARRSTPEGDRLKQHLARLYVDKLTCSDPVPLFHVGMSRYALRSKLP